MRHSIFLLSQYVLYNNFSSQIALVVHCFYVVDIYCRQIYRLPLIHISIYWERKKCPLPLMVRYQKHLYKYISMVTLMMFHLIFFYMHQREKYEIYSYRFKENILKIYLFCTQEWYANKISWNKIPVLVNYHLR